MIPIRRYRNPALQRIAGTARILTMKLLDLPQGMIDWSLLQPRTIAPGETGSAAARMCLLGDTRVRLVEYGAGYVADHWCDKGISSL